ncbi:MAG: NAD(+) synthase [Sphaerochaetaceae bacterium]
MRDGFIKVAAITAPLKVGDLRFNSEQSIQLLSYCGRENVDLALFSELSLTASTCGELFRDDFFVRESLKALKEVIESSKESDTVAAIGLPLAFNGKLFNCSVVFQKGEVLAIVPKSDLSNTHRKYFSRPNDTVQFVKLFDSNVAFGTNILFQSSFINEFNFSVTIGEHIFKESYEAAILLNPKASYMKIGLLKEQQELNRVVSKTASLAIVSSGASLGESTTDRVYCNQNMIVENGKIIALGEDPYEGALISEVDVKLLMSERVRKQNNKTKNSEAHKVYFSHRLRETTLTREIRKYPFVPSEKGALEERSLEILKLQSLALAKRINHVGSKKVVLGVSGGLDSTLALIVAVMAFDYLNLDRKGIVSVTMPCFGTTKRTYENAIKLSSLLGVTLKEIDISESVRAHFKDINHDEKITDTVYENAQARRRTHILMDIGNQIGGFVIGTGDLSEIALGWATFNGDHMSMYSVNSSIPKTLINHLIRYYATHLSVSKELPEVLEDIISTPVSPELLPTDIGQATEKIIGPYVLHDFFIYNMLRLSYSPQKIVRLAKTAFDGEFSEKEIIGYLRIFIKRFFANQFKRSVFADGVQVGSVSLSPRGEFSLASDTSSALWLEELDKLEGN